MEDSQVYILDHCRMNCAKASHEWGDLYEVLDAELAKMNLEGILKEKFQKILYHHRPKIALSGCPNGCSQPRIKDIGVIAYTEPVVNESLCIHCQVCVKTCMEQAIVLENGPKIDEEHCMACGACIKTCPTGALTQGEKGWKLYTGGRVGRHPRFAEFMGREDSEERISEWVKGILLDYSEHCESGERLTDFLERRVY